MTTNLPEKKENSLSDRFTGMVMREYSANAGSIEFGPYQKKLVQHLFIKVDMVMKELETKRQNSGKNTPAISWANVNLNKLAVDTVHRVELGLDALIPNHIHPIPYLNGRTQKYDLDLRIGYQGKDYYYRQMATDEIVDIIYELVHSNDRFTVIKRSIQNPVEAYEFEITNPFDRGEVVGGFGYIMYQDERKNKLVIVTKSDFEKSRTAARSNDFWSKHPENMQYKTIVHRTVTKMVLDPKKINAAFATVEAEDNNPMNDEMMAMREIDEHANNGDIIDIVQTVDVPGIDEMSPVQEGYEPDPTNDAVIDGPGF